ncbi:MAG: hypothetical protein JWM74_2704 [Myxococcaceae bacterium]|nr:hypothetical protein [Myxococcaceae bacterium]
MTPPADKFVSEAASGLRPRAILVFDPDVASLNFLAMAFRRRGYEPLPAASLEEANVVLETSPVTLAICRLRATHIEGSTVLAMLKARDGVRAIAIRPGPEVEARGADLSFVAPVPIIVLIRAIEQLTVPAPRALRTKPT